MKRRKEPDVIETSNVTETSNGTYVRTDDDLRVRRDGPDLKRRDERIPADMVPEPVRRDDLTNTPIMERPVVIRGGLALGGVLTGVLTALGAMVLLGAIVGGILAATHVTANDLTTNTQTISIGAGIAFVIAQFLAYLWGGYTAGRMARGAGALNGLMVPLLTLVIGAGVAAIVKAMGANATIGVPYVAGQRLPVSTTFALNLSIGIGIASLIAMFAGGMLGGMRGAKWHERLEDPRVAHPAGHVLA